MPKQRNNENSKVWTQIRVGSLFLAVILIPCMQIGMHLQYVNNTSIIVGCNLCKHPWLCIRIHVFVCMRVCVRI